MNSTPSLTHNARYRDLRSPIPDQPCPSPGYRTARNDGGQRHHDVLGGLSWARHLDGAAYIFLLGACNCGFRFAEGLFHAA